jgi:hypothetical protein
MVDFAKRARRTGDIEPDEEVLAGFNATPSPFGIGNAGMTGGLIAGGAVGMAVGAAWDRSRAKKLAEEQAGKGLPDIVGREPFEPPIPTNGTLFAVTTKRIVVWTIAGLGKPKDMLLSIPLSDVDSVVWEEADTKLLGGRPGSLMMWIGVGGEQVLACAGISMGPAGKYVKHALAALEERLPGRVVAWEG